MPARPAPLLELVGVTKRFPGVVALDNVSFDLAAGEVHALVGENGAGKSTLINIVSGFFAPDAGKMTLAGQPVAWRSPVDARAQGIATVHQEADLFPTLSVAENMGLERGLPVGWGGWVRRARLDQQARDAVAQLDEPIDERQPAARLSVAQRHMVQIAAAVRQSARVLVLDEPTSALTAEESAWLFRQIRRLKTAGAGILYISHRQSEIFELADRITVLRDGRRVWTGASSTTTPEALIKQMVGRDRAAASGGVARRGTTVRQKARLEVQRLSAADGRFTEVSLRAYGGEILGVYGLIGSGRSEVAQTLFGLRQARGGALRIDGKATTAASPVRAVESGLAYLPEDRLRQSIFSGLSVRANTVISALNRLGHGWLTNAARERQSANQQRANLAIKCRDVEQPIAELSGGNQQKVVLARCLLMEPAVLILDEPTRGVDVASKAEIHRILRDQAEAGTAIVMISSELAEVVENSDRVLVFSDGRIAAEFEGDAISAEAIAAKALPGTTPGANVPKDRPGHKAFRRWRSETALVAANAAMILILAATTDAFLTLDNLWGLLATTAVWCILSLGAATTILAGAIDISLGSLLALSAGVGGLVLKAPYPAYMTIPAAVVAALAVGALGGLSNAAISLWGRVHPIVVTLGTMTVYRGLLIALTGGDTISELPEGFVNWSSARWLGVNGSAALGAATALAMYLWLNRFRGGRHVVAFGSSPTAARQVGISHARTWLAAFAAGGLLAALAGMLELSQTGSLQSGTGTGYELQAIAAAVIGGVSITGGRGSVGGVCLGALLLGLIYNGLVLWQVSRYHYELVTGGLLLCAVIADLAWRRLER